MKKNRILTAVGIIAFFSLVIITSIVMINNKTGDSAKGNTVVEGISSVSRDDVESIVIKQTEYFPETTPEVDLNVSIESDETSATIHSTSNETVQPDISTQTGYDSNTSESRHQTTTTTSSAVESDKHEGTTEGTVAVPASPSEENHNSSENSGGRKYIEFTFKKLNADKMSPDYNWARYFDEKGYIRINGIDDLKNHTKSLLGSISEQEKPYVNYIVAKRGVFDYISDPSNGKDYFMNCMGLDYQTYVCIGVPIVQFKKIQDIRNNNTDVSVYAIYYYSYLTSEKINIQEEEITHAIPNFTGNEYDKIKGVHDFICSRTGYDFEMNSGIESHTAYGALILKKAVCEGYAKAFKLFMDKLSIPCEYVINDTHAWNEVCIDGRWYVVDVTYDDGENDNKYKYFLIGHDRMSDTYGYGDGSNSSVNSISDVSYSHNNEQDETESVNITTEYSSDSN